jgi:hypothetical protein
MAAQDRSLRQKRVAGAIVLGAILGMAWGVTRISRLFEPTREAYVATTTTAAGAAGLEAGGPVLYGGAPRGYITSVDPTIGDDGKVSEIRIGFELDRSLPLASNASIVRSVGVAGSGGAVSVLDPGDPALAFTGTDDRVIPMNRGSVTPADGAIVFLGRRNAELLRSIQASMKRFDENIDPRMIQAAKTYRSLQLALDRLELDVESDDVRRSSEQRLASVIQQVQAALPELERALISSGNAMQTLEQEVRVDDRRIQRGIGIASRNFGDVKTIVADIESEVDASLVPKVLEIRRDSLQALADSERLLADGRIAVSEVGTSIPVMLANMKLAGGQLALAFDDLLGLALEAIMIAPDADSATRRRLLEAVDTSVRASMDVRLAADRMRTITELDPSFVADHPEATTSFIEPFQTAVDRLEATLEQLSRTLIDAVVADGDASPTRKP